MNPSPSTTLQRPDLGETLIQYDVDAGRMGFVGLKLAPVKDVPLQAANIGRIKLEQLMTDGGDTGRAADGSYNRDHWTFDEFSYATTDRGHEVPVDARLRQIYRRYFDAEVVAARRARDKVLRSHEKRVCDLLSATGSFTNAAAGTAWSTHASATPLTNVRARLIAVRNATGVVPNVVVMDWEAFINCRECAEIVDRLKYSGYDDPKNVGPNALAELFNVDEVIVAGGQRNSANQAQARSLTSLWPKATVGVGVIARGGDAEDMIQPAVARTFHWSEDGSTIGGTIEEYFSDERRCNVIRCRQDTEEKVIYSEMWQLITGVL